MSMQDRIYAQFAQSIEAKVAAQAVMPADIARAVQALVGCLQAKGKIMVCGNGGSAADAQHFAAELINRFEIERPPLAALALTTDSSNLTSIGNDYSFEDIFAKQVRALGRSGDALIAISTSGNSANVIAAIRDAQKQDMTLIALTGGGGGKMAGVLRPQDVHLCVPATRTARIQEVHLLILHCLCDGIDYALYPGKLK